MRVPIWMFSYEGLELVVLLGLAASGFFFAGRPDGMHWGKAEKESLCAKCFHILHWSLTSVYVLFSG